MAETWSIKTSPSLPSSAIQWSSGFVSDGIYFTKITIGTDKITYTNSLGDTDVYTSSTWVKDNYRTVAFINSPSGTLLTWLNANATKLVTSTKTISYDNLTVFKALMDNKYDISLDGKLDKIKGPFSGYDRLYAVSSNGVQYGVGYTSAIGKSTIVARNGTGEILVPTPTSDDGAVPKTYVDTSLDGKLDKKTYTSAYPQLYVKVGNGSQSMVSVTENKVANTAVLRNADNGVACNTQLFTEPDWYDNTTITTMPLVNMTSSDKLIMLPLDNIIVEKSVDGGETWTAYGDDSTSLQKAKRSLFTGTNDQGMQLPKIDGKNSPLCMVRVTITGMTYNVPEGTAETERYNYWNKDYIKASYRYCSINNLWFWIIAADNRIQVKVEGATGAAPDNWTEFGNIPNASGWSGAAQVRINPERTFGGGTAQTSNYWNWRITFREVGRNGETDGTNFNASTYNMNIISIKGFGKSIWTYGYNTLAGLNSIFRIRSEDYNFEMQQGSYYPAWGASYDLGANTRRWRFVYAQYFSEGGVLLSDKYAAIADLDNKLDKATSAIQDSVYGISVTKGIEPFQTDSVLYPTSQYSPTSIGVQVLKYKTIVGLSENGYGGIDNAITCEILTNKITVTPSTDHVGIITFRFACTPGANFKLNYSGTGISYCAVQLFTNDGTRLGKLPTAYYNNYTITIPSDYEQDPAYGMLTISSSTAGQDLVITSASLTPQDASLPQVLYPISTSAIAGTLVERNGKGEIKVATPTEDDSAANKAYVDSTIGDKLDKVSSATDYIQVYAKLQSGTQTMRDVSTEFVPNGIVMRDENNQVWTPNPTYDFAATPKTYVDTALDGKVDKVTTRTTLAQLYCKTADGRQTMATIQPDAATPGTIVRRTQTGKIKTGDPVDALDAVNKQSMDAAIQGATVMITDLRSGS